MTTAVRDEQQIARAATLIAGNIFEDATGDLEARLNQAIQWQNQGTDSDMSDADRDCLRLLMDEATGITSDLTDSETGEVIRTATIAEACESAKAGPEGHIVVDWRAEGGWHGEDYRKCYVAL